MSAIPENERQNLVRDLDLSFMSVDSRGNIKPKTPQAAIVADQTYLLATQPAANDPWAAMHRSTLMSLGMVGASLADKEIVQRSDRSLRRRNSPRREIEVRRSSSPRPRREIETRRSSLPRQVRFSTRDEDARHGITQRRVDRSRADRDSSKKFGR